MKKELDNIRLEEFIFELRSQGRYTVTLTEIKEKLKSKTEEAVKQSMFRMKSNGSLAHLRREFYLIIPPEYSNGPGLPLYLFIDDLMKFLGREYYVGLFTAAALHGASHQSSMIDEVIVTGSPLRPIENDKISIKFHNKNQLDKDQIIQMKSDSGYFNVSSPELTALDLIYYSKEWGIERILSVLDELKEVMKPQAMYNCALNYSTATIKRLGFLTEEYLEDIRLSDKLYKAYTKNPDSNYTYLSASAEKKGEINARWKIIKNIDPGNIYDT